MRLYDIEAFGRMIDDPVRVAAYAKALTAAIAPGAIVLDIGAGAGLWSLLACRLGARRVYAVDPHPAIEIAQELAERNECGAVVQVVRVPSVQLQLRERADVIVSDLRGVLPFFGEHIPAVVDARTRLLRTGGCLIPQRDRIWVAAVTAPDKYAELVRPWSMQQGIDLTPGRRWVLNAWVKLRFGADQLATDCALAATLDYSTITSASLDTEVRLTVRERATAHGLGVWFDTDLFEDCGFSNAPGMPEALYGRAFFPWLHPVALERGDSVVVRLSAFLVDGEYVWRWRTRIATTAGEPRAEFNQSTFWNSPIQRDRVSLASADFVPPQSEDTVTDAFILSSCDGMRSTAAISRLVSNRFPAQFRTPRDALSRVTRVISRYA